MIRFIIHEAHRLDLWLQSRLGRPYNAILGLGLTVEVIRRVVELPEHLGHAPRLGVALVLIVMNAALLIHQVGALSHRFHRPLAGDGHGDGEPGPAEAPESGRERRLR